MKKVTKFLLVLLLALVCIFTLVAGACAQGEENVTVVFNGEELEFDVAPQIFNGRTLVPLRAIFEKVGALVEWDDATNTVTATKGDTVVILTIDSIYPTINGEIVELDQPGIIVNNRTLAPLRFVAEAFGGEVEWDPDSWTAYISISVAEGDGETDGPAAGNTNGGDDGEAVTMLLYQGHGSFRITSKNGIVIYVDPYAGEGYDVPADIVLVTHQHGDHNQIDLVTQKPDCEIIQNFEALEGGQHNSFDIDGINIKAVTAANENHDPAECVGYLITVDGVKIYAAGDTSKTDEMESFADLELDYALLPCDGIFNMGLEEAAECAALIGAKHNIPIHIKPGELFDMELAEQFDAPDRLIVEPGEEITLTPAK